MLLYLLLLVGIVLIYRFYHEGFSNPFGTIDNECLFNSDIKGPVKYIEPDGVARYTKENDFINIAYSDILKKADENTYLSSYRPAHCRI